MRVGEGFTRVCCISFVAMFLLSACASKPSSGNVSKVAASGTGNTCTAAIENAKKVAVENANGSYVTSKQTVDDGKYQESISEYAGGFVESYEVLQQSGNSPCKVKIQAMVRTQYNTIAESSSKAIDLSGYQKLVKQRGSAQAAITATFVKYPPIVTSQKFNPNTKTLVVVVEPQKKFLEDVKGILMTVEKPRLFKGGFSGVFSGFGKRRDDLYSYKGGFCFDKDDGDIACFNQQAYSLRFNILVNGVSVSTNPPWRYVFDYLDIGKYCDDTVCAQRFPIARKQRYEINFDTNQNSINVTVVPNAPQ